MSTRATVNLRYALLVLADFVVDHYFTVHKQVLSQKFEVLLHALHTGKCDLVAVEFNRKQ